MSQLGIVRTAWSGTTGGPGLTQLAFGEVTAGDITNGMATAAATAVRAFWNSMAGFLPNEIVLTVQPVVDVYEATNGALVASHVLSTPPAAVLGTDTGVYGMAQGVKANLHTGVIRERRRVRGAMYIVPAGQSAYTNLGLISSTAKTAVNTNGATMLGSFAAAGIDLLVWSRPATPTSNDGLVARVTGIEGNEKSAILRGRRD